jgi:hypothetical protein
MLQVVYMVSERLISRFEESLIELSEISGSKEKTSIITNLEVIDAAPGITGFIIVEDSKDGDYITAATIPGMIYANGDLVNVLFIDGTEPIAYQHGSGSGGVAFTVDRVYRPDFTATVLTGDNSNDVTLTAGDLIIPDDIVHSGDTDTLISLEDDKIVVQAGGLSLLSLTETTQDLVEIGDVAGGGDVDINLNNGQVFIQGSDGNTGFGTTTPGTDRVAFQGPSGANLAVGFYAGDGDGTDFVSLVMYGVGTPGSITNRERLIFQYNPLGPNFRLQSEADGTGTLRPFSLETEGNAAQLFLDTNGRVGVNSSAPSALLAINQSSTTAAIPVVFIRQADVSEEFIFFQGSAAAATLTQSIVAEADVTTATRQGFVKIEIQDDGNQVTDQAYFVPFYTLA